MPSKERSSHFLYHETSTEEKASETVSGVEEDTSTQSVGVYGDVQISLSSHYMDSIRKRCFGMLCNFL